MKLGNLIDFVREESCFIETLDGLYYEIKVNQEYIENWHSILKYLKALDIIRKRISPLGRVSFMPMSQEEHKIIQEVLNSET